MEILHVIGTVILHKLRLGRSHKSSDKSENREVYTSRKA